MKLIFFFKESPKNGLFKHGLRNNHQQRVIRLSKLWMNSSIISIISAPLHNLIIHLKSSIKTRLQNNFVISLNLFKNLYQRQCIQYNYSNTSQMAKFC